MSRTMQRWSVISIFAVFGATQSAAARDDEVEEKYRKALVPPQEAAALNKRAAELDAKAAKSQDKDEQQRLRDEAAGLRKSAEERMSEARKLMEELALLEC